MARTGNVQNFDFDKEVFADYMQEQSLFNSAIINSGIMVQDPILASVASSGNVGSVPFFHNIDAEGDALNFDGTTDNTPTALAGGKQTFMAMGRMKAWKDTDFVRYLIGKSPLQNLANNLVVPYYTREWQKSLVSILTGVLGVSGMSTHVLDLTSSTSTATDANKVNLTSYLDCEQKACGDNRDAFRLFIAHSAVVANLKKQELVTYRQYTDPNTLASYELPVYGNMIVLETDTGTVDTSGTLPVYTSFLAGVGTILSNQKEIPNPYYTDYDAETDGGINKLYTKQAMIMHPNGFSLAVDNIVSESPTNTELATSSNWTLKFNSDKLIPLACIKSNG